MELFAAAAAGASGGVVATYVSAQEVIYAREPRLKVYHTSSDMFETHHTTHVQPLAEAGGFARRWFVVV
jgi:hypothetical protein